ncbi:T9SS type B sorting domain-containing protein [Flavobacterium undicola]|uniref:T9SS type B sorting domain-containing protein n=1 Tax=Flavobacterium undicola TaxID=1932779 RepID=UPI001377A9E2|nr:T9SS type B sorting domain-containing protein [Flavobacterium undicola]MBA0882529.1 T9SS type B sorting domain-containing protein [Flavobacterium undicola]
MNKKLLIIFFFLSLDSYAQGESNIWYFGGNAGLDFNSGSPVALTDGRSFSFSACASISDSNGQLLFYTNAFYIWDKNHMVMPNGSFLLGHANATQGATIVPKPGSSNLYYLFTVDYEGGPNGFRYSVIDMNLNGGLGDVTAEKNVLIYTPTTERLAIVRHANKIDYWVVTHGPGNTFYSYLLTASGLNVTPVLSNVGTLELTKSNYQGQMKISPDGSKLVIVHNVMNAEMFDFDNSSGLISNPIILRTNQGSGAEMYGVEFSPNSRVLYLSLQGNETTQNGIIQYDLNSNDIVGSAFTMLTPKIIRPMALQLGPDGKIYVAKYGKLGVINYPNLIGLSCDLQQEAVDLGTGRCYNGLPGIVSSFLFKSEIDVENLCLTQSTQFKLHTNHTMTSATWDFGDGHTSNDLTPTHIYTSAGTYTVSVQAASAIDKTITTREITISPIPTATQPTSILACDDDNDGLYAFDLTTQNPMILNGQDPAICTVNYFANADDYANNVAITDSKNYSNKAPYQQETIIAEVSNTVNKDCKSTTTFTIDVFDTPKPGTGITNLAICDNSSVGSDADGKVVLDLTQKTSSILNGQLATQFLISYYKDSGLLQSILTPEAYQNTNTTETIYVKVVNKDNPDCTATTSFKIEVLALPLIANTVDLKQCDDNIDGFSVFNLEEAISKITASVGTQTIAFFETALDAQNNTNPIPNPTNYTNQTVSTDQVFVRVANTNNCFRIAQLNLIVSTTQIPLTFKKNFTQCDDAISGTNIDGIASFDFSEVTNQIQSIFPIGQQFDIRYYRNLTDALAEKNSISDISNYRNIGYPNTQNIYIRVDSRLNNDCLGLGNHITLTVEPIPIVQSMKQNHCDDNQDGVYAFDTSAIQTNLLNGLTNVTVSYFDQNNNRLSSPLPNPFITVSQTLKVVITNTTSTACSFESSLQFIVDKLPQAFPIAPSLTTVCDDEIDPVLQDGKYAFDTSGFQTAILGGQTAMSVNYFDGNNNPLSSPLPNPFLTATQNIKAEVFNPVNHTCSATTVIPFVVNPVPNIQLIGDELVCSDLPTFTKVINAGLLDETQKNNFAYSWTLDGNLIVGETNYDLIVNKKGVYQVEVINNQGCSRTRTITVNASDKAAVQVDIVDLSSQNSITILATGAGDYVFSLDDENGDYQTSNIFANVPAGIHNVFVKDLNGCGIVSQEVAVLGIPSYFTPNQDGYNDTWNLKGVNTVFNPKTTVRIFDRYGKLIKEINPMGDGWDGTRLGQQMPAADYWYSIQLQDGRILKGHFALKR